MLCSVYVSLSLSLSFFQSLTESRNGHRLPGFWTTRIPPFHSRQETDWHKSAECLMLTSVRNINHNSHSVAESCLIWHQFLSECWHTHTHTHTRNHTHRHIHEKNKHTQTQTLSYRNSPIHTPSPSRHKHTHIHALIFTHIFMLTQIQNHTFSHTKSKL